MVLVHTVLPARCALLAGAIRSRVNSEHLKAPRPDAPVCQPGGYQTTGSFHSRRVVVSSLADSREAAVYKTRHMEESQGQVVALAFR